MTTCRTCTSTLNCLKISKNNPFFGCHAVRRVRYARACRFFLCGRGGKPESAPVEAGGGIFGHARGCAGAAGECRKRAGEAGGGSDPGVGRERMRSHLFGWGDPEPVCGRRDYRGRSGAVRRAGPWRGRLSGGVFRMMCSARCGTGAGPDAAGLRRESSARGAGAGCAGDPSALSLCAKSAR